MSTDALRKALVQIINSRQSGRIGHVEPVGDFITRLKKIAVDAVNATDAALSADAALSQVTQERVEFLEGLFDFSDPEVVLHHSPNDPVTKDAVVVRLSHYETRCKVDLSQQGRVEDVHLHEILAQEIEKLAPKEGSDPAMFSGVKRVAAKLRKGKDIGEWERCAIAAMRRVAVPQPQERIAGSGRDAEAHIADVWHEGTKSFYRAQLLEKLTEEEALFDPVDDVIADVPQAQVTGDK